MAGSAPNGEGDVVAVSGSVARLAGQAQAPAARPDRNRRSEGAGITGQLQKLVFLAVCGTGQQRLQLGRCDGLAAVIDQMQGQNTGLGIHLDRGVPTQGLLRVPADVEVLAVDSNDDPLSEQPKLFARATLSVTVDDAKKLSVAAGLGDLSLALRGAREPEQQKISMPASKVAAARTPPRRTTRRAVARKPANKQIKVLLGDEETEVKVPTAAQTPSEPKTLIPAS